ncbi:MAG: glycosyltransferase involved in cell wall biosynthesis [Flavobacteriaceae bacterium]|jgi:glycosyltransferase involved in cell wall biosynthesis
MNSKIHKNKVSIFMPVYNGAKYLSKSIESVLNQTYENFELICVDDSSTDNSYELLNFFADKDSRVTIYQKPNGGTVPKSWNYVLPKIKGDFILYMSQDDHISIDNLEKLISRQLETDADCILPDLRFYYDKEKNNAAGRIGINGNRDLILTNREAVLLSLNWKIHGFGLWKAEIFKNEIFPEDSFDSDEYMVRKFFFKCNKVAFCDGIFYYRQDNQNAITKSFEVKNYYSLLRDYRIYKLLKNNNFEPEIINEKRDLLFSSFINNYKYYLSMRGLNSINESKGIHNHMKETFHLFKNENSVSIQNYRMDIYKKIMFTNFSFFKYVYNIRFFLKNLFFR